MKLLTAIQTAPFSSSFEGKILQPGSQIAVVDLPPHPVLIECAGPVGNGKSREYLWVLWKLEWQSLEWKELARSQSSDASWTYVFREPARQALYPSDTLYDVKAKAAPLVAVIMAQVQGVLAAEPLPVQIELLNTLYDAVAGLIAGLAA